MERLITHVRNVVKKQGVFKPLFVTDIDGVLVRGPAPVEGTRDAVIALRQEGIPLALLTNGGGYLQYIKADKMNETFKENLFDRQLMFMSHSPIRPHLRKFSNEGGVLLLTGSLRINDIVDTMGISNYVTADELHAIFHGPSQQLKSHPTLTFNIAKDDPDKIKQRIKARLGRQTLPTSYEEWTNEIKAIFALNDVNPYEKALEVIHNVFAEKKRKGSKLPPYFAGHNDIAFAGGYHRPRMAFGPFNYMLEDHCERHGFNLDKHYYGKPAREVFQYVQDIMVQKYGDGCFFMIGDNPRADIKGASEIGWASFLTQTGVHQGAENDPENPATMVVNTFAETVEAVLKIKREKLYL